MTNERAEFSVLQPRRAASSRVAAPPPVGAAEPVMPSEAAVPSGADEQSVPVVPPDPVVPVEPDEAELGDNGARELAAFDEETFVAAVREEAIRFASIATARVLRVTLRDPRELTNYVDDALRACGRAPARVVSLHPDDAAAYRPQRGVDVVADPARERGEIVIAVAGGEFGATLEERAELLVRAAACA